MATFYGQVSGMGSTAATRTGSKRSGIRSSAQSYDGSIITELRYNKDDELVVSIDVAEGSSVWGKTVFTGTLAELVEKLSA